MTFDYFETSTADALLSATVPSVSRSTSPGDSEIGFRSSCGFLARSPRTVTALSYNMGKPGQSRNKRNTRSKSCGRLQLKDPSAAVSDATLEHSLGSPTLSPPQNSALPLHDQNINNVDASWTGDPPEVRKSVNSSLILDEQVHSEGYSVTPASEPAIFTSKSNQCIDNETALGDNTVSADQDNDNASAGSGELEDGRDLPLQKTLQEETLRLVLAELRDIKSQMSEIKDIKSKMNKLDKIEATTNSLVGEISGVVQRTAELDTAVTSNAARLREVDDELSTMKASICKQDRFLSKVSDWKEEVKKSNSSSVSKMNELIKTQQKQVDLFHENTNQVKRDLEVMKEVDKKLSQSKQNQMKEIDKKISQSKQNQDTSAQNTSKIVRREVMAEVDKKVSDLKQDMQSQSLKDQAFNNRFNLIVLGLKEDEHKSTVDLVKEYFTNTVGVKDSAIATAYRLGSRSDAGDSYSRPIMVKFSKLPHRNRIWRKRMNIPNEDGASRVKIQADLPKVLREGMQVMYRVLRAAIQLEEFKSAQINNYQLELNGQIYQVSDLEKLPVQIRPSTLSSPK